MLARYRIVEKLGAGGMGVVYRVEDTDLKRPVALKFLSAKAAAGAAHRARFLREAQVAAALNHPNICTIHEVGEVQPGEDQSLPGGEVLEAGTPFIAMELVEGRPLSEMLGEASPLPLDQLLRISVRIAEGLAHAHVHSVVHRDLKPGNVMLTAEDGVKLLDFGLAKSLMPSAKDDVDMTLLETVSGEMTREGTVLGTAPYMSPEQAMGKPVDPRSDVFSFGTMLYEMATGKRPFRGESSTSTLAKILESEPEPIEDSRTDLPVELHRIIRRCLKKNPDDRYNDTRDLVAALKDLREETTSASAKTGVSTSTGAAQPQRRLRWFHWSLLAVAVIALTLAAALYGWTRRAPATASVLSPSHRQVTFLGTADLPALSPDGRSIAFVSREKDIQRVLMMDLEGGDPLEIFRGRNITRLLWSPSGSELLLNGVSDSGPHRIHVVPRFGGTTRSFEASYPLSFDWGPDGMRFAFCGYTDVKSLWLVNKTSGDMDEIALAEPVQWLVDLDWSPSGDWIALVTYESEAGRSSIHLIRPDGTQQREILELDFPGSIRWGPASDTIYLYQLTGVSGDIWKFDVDPATGRRTSELVPVLSGLLGGAPLSISDDGRLVAYPKVTAFSNLRMVEKGDEATSDELRVTELTTGTWIHNTASFSPEGSRIAYIRGLGVQAEVFTQDLHGGPPRQLTFFDALSWAPVWSPDGKEIAFGSELGDTPRVWRVGADGGTPRALEATATLVASSLRWCPGSGILYGTNGNRNLMLLDTDTGEERALVDDESVGWIFAGECSPDGSRVAVMWNRSRQTPEGRKFGPGVWIIDLEDSSASLVLDRDWGERYPMPIGWSDDGNWLYVLDGEDLTEMEEFSDPRISRVPASGGEPEAWMELPLDRVIPRASDISPDGRRFVGTHMEVLSDIWLTENFDPEAQ